MLIIHALYSASPDWEDSASLYTPRFNTKTPFPTVGDREGGRCITACREAIVPSPHKLHL